MDHRHRVGGPHPHEELRERFRREKIPVLVGTQMVAKGLDFENVTLVGVIAPDLSLYVDDSGAGGAHLLPAHPGGGPGGAGGNGWAGRSSRPSPRTTT